MRYVFKNKFYAIFFYIFDFIGSVVFLPGRLIHKRNLVRNPKNILIIRLDHIGDVAAATSVPHNLKIAYPEARITFLVSSSSAGLLLNNPYINEMICFDAPWFSRGKKNINSWAVFWKLVKELKKVNFDLGFDLRGDFRHIILMWLARVKFRVSYGVTGGGFLLSIQGHYHKNLNALDKNLYLLEKLNIKLIIRKQELFLSNEEVRQVDDFLSSNNLNQVKFCIVHPVAGYTSKNWQEDKFAVLISKLYKELKVSVILVGLDNDRDIVEHIIAISGVPAINIAGKTSLRFLIALIQRANLFIGVDSGPSHIAAALDKPTLILYSGTNQAQEWAPKGNQVIIIQKDVACKSCEKPECHIKTCMELISVEEVFDVAKSMFLSEAQ